MILAIDPGNIESGFVLVKNNLEIIKKGKVPNEELLENLLLDRFWRECDDGEDYVAIEMVASYGMPVGATVFETCVWIGRFIQAIQCGIEPKFIYREQEKLNLCNTKRAKDSNIVQALIDRFAPNTPNKGKGTKKEPGWFYGFKKDIWQAYAVAVTYHDLYLTKEG